MGTALVVIGLWVVASLVVALALGRIITYSDRHEARRHDLRARERERERERRHPASRLRARRHRSPGPAPRTSSRPTSRSSARPPAG